MQVEVSGQLVTLLSDSLGSNSETQTWREGPLPAELPHQSWFLWWLLLLLSWVLLLMPVSQRINNSIQMTNFSFLKLLKSEFLKESSCLENVRDDEDADPKL